MFSWPCCSVTRPVTEASGTSICNQPEARISLVGKWTQTYNMTLTITGNMSQSYLFGRLTKPLRIKLYNAAQHVCCCLFFLSGLIDMSSALI